MSTTVDLERPVRTEPTTRARGRTTGGPPLSKRSWGAGLMLATFLFVASMAMWFSFSRVVPADFSETAVPAYAVSQGSLRCAYPAANKSPVPPLYPVVAVSVMALTGIAGMTYPTATPLARHCSSVNLSVFAWHGPLLFMGLVGLLGWPILLTGLLLLIRASCPVRTRRDILGLCLIGCAPPVAGALVQIFHPEDLFATGLILASLAAVVRQRWTAAGVLIGLACCAKQYALLAAVPLVVVAPGRERWRFVRGALAVGAVIVVPLGIMMGRGLVAALAGTNATPPGQGGLIGMVSIGAARIALSRGSPLLLAAVAAFWVRRRLGASVFEPPLLTALIATSLALRLVFEVSLYDYYFLALAVALVAVDMVSGRIRLPTVVWVLAAGAFFPSGFGPLLRMDGRFPVVIQMVVVLPGLLLAARPLWRACRAVRPVAPAIAPSTVSPVGAHA